MSYLHKITSYYCLQNCCERQKRDVSLVEDLLLKILKRAGSIFCINSLHLRQAPGKEKHARYWILEKTKVFFVALPYLGPIPSIILEPTRVPSGPGTTNRTWNLESHRLGSDLNSDTSCGTLSEPLNHSEPQFPRLWNSKSKSFRTPERIN